MGSASVERVQHVVNGIAEAPADVLRTQVAIEIVNRLREATAIHWHGIELESYDDGVPGSESCWRCCID